MSESAWCDSSATDMEQQASPSGNHDAKIFVGGLEWSTTADDLKTYFEKFGVVVECEVKTDHHTGQSRGFAFVKFDDPSSVDMVLNVRDHFIDGRKVDPKRIKFRDTLKPIHKVFVGGVDTNITEEAIREYFSQFGTIDEIDLPYDHQKQERRRFCFVRFTSNEPVERLCQQPLHTIAGQTVEVKKMMNKAEKSMQGTAMSMADYVNYDFGHRGRGRGISAFNAGTAHYGTSYVDSRQGSWQQSVAEYGARQPFVSDYSSPYGGVRHSSMMGHGRLSAAPAYGGIGSSPMIESASFRGGRQSSSSRGSASFGGSRQMTASSYGSFGDNRVSGGLLQNYTIDHTASANGDGISWPTPMNYQPRYSGTAIPQFVRAPAGPSGMSRGQRYQPYSR